MELRRSRRGVPCSLVGIACALFLSALGVGASTARAEDNGFTWLLDRQTYKLDAEGRWTALIEAERKAHTARAAREGGRIDIPYQASLLRIEILEADTIKSDGRRVAVASDRIIDIAPRAARDVALYTDLRTRSIVFPDLEAGDTIRYVYRLTTVHRTWPGFSWSAGWRRSSRVVLSERIFDRPAGMPLFEEHHGVEYRVESGPDRVRQVFTWRNEQSAPDEAGSTSPLDWAPRFVVSTFGAYGEIGDHYGKLHAAAAAVTPAIEALANEIVGAARDHTTEARLLYDWTRRNIRYVGVAIGQGKLTPVMPAETVANRYGDCKAHVALLAALLAARGIQSEPALINVTSPRYTLPEIPVADWDHVVLYLPELDLYLDPTSLHSSFGSLAWGHYDKPVLHAVVGRSRIARVPRQRAEDNLGETHTTLTIWSDGRITGSTREKGVGTAAADLVKDASQTDAALATSQLRFFGSPGTGKWTTKPGEASDGEAEIGGEFALSDAIDLGAGEALLPPAGLRFLVRPGGFLLGTHDTARTRPFPCYAGRQIETIEVILPAGWKPVRLPANRLWTTAIAEYRSSYRFHGGTLYVRREFVAHPEGQVCTPAQSQELVGFLSNLRRDYRSVVVFDARL
jgi:transglutaminase-like putative cysteine protease